VVFILGAGDLLSVLSKKPVNFEKMAAIDPKTPKSIEEIMLCKPVFGAISKNLNIFLIKPKYPFNKATPRSLKYRTT
jgi:hypothetical protein